MNIIICDNSNVDRGILELTLTDIFEKEGVSLNITQCSSFREFSKCFSPEHDVVFMDIYLKDGNGLDIVKHIRKSNETIPVIFVTSSTDFLLESYNVFAYNYLVKPLDYDKVSALMKRLLKEKQLIERPEPEYPLRDTRGNVRISIPYSKIEYIESFNTVLMFHITNGLEFKMYGTLKGVFNELNDERFIHCHQSYIANLEHVQNIKDSAFIMKSGAEVLIRKKGLKEIKNQYLNYTLHNS